MGFTLIVSQRQLNIDTAPFYAYPYSQRESKKGISGHDKTMKAEPCGIVLKKRKPFFYSRTATFRMTDGNYTKETFAAERR